MPDYIIVGQGLAGSIMALRLIERGCTVLVIDDGYKHCSSQVAAGIWNPVNFRKNRPAWKAATLVPCLQDFYSVWEKKFQLKFVHPRLIIRPFQTIDQQNDWMALSGDSKSDSFFSDEATEDLQGIKMDFKDGYGVVRGGGFIDVPLFLKACKSWLENQGSYLQADFDFYDVKHIGSNVYYHNFHAKGIIFCEGHKAERNPWFSYLPFNNAKGETIKIKSSGLPAKNITSKGVWIVPIGDDQYKVGATFAWDDFTAVPTAWALYKLKEDLDRFVDAPYEVLDQEAGIRPATADRRPFVGTHPEAEGIHIFNGLGTKGVLTAPWLASHFADYLLENIPLDPEVDILRHVKNYKSHA